MNNIDNNIAGRDSAAAIGSARRYASIKKARKTWLCSTCGSQIKPGDAYEFSYAYGGDDIQNKCSKCACVAPNG